MVVLVLVYNGGQVEGEFAMHVGERPSHLPDVFEDNVVPMGGYWE